MMMFAVLPSQVVTKNGIRVASRATSVTQLYSGMCVSFDSILAGWPAIEKTQPVGIAYV